ncbi:hypothetical protein TGFOU_321610 [Toxoplasma gondii FOU]|uniref:Homologous recombination OB-fold protein OB-fold domain-containing protein n=3 Tax=Toxoplasma gondii TaxID=5811 RepID=A0A086JQK6_TOXGO|nr:hypothetical protein TGFOU_321610 [Toxoplasma gondii FOU]
MEKDFDLEDVFNDEGKELHAKQRPEAHISPSSKLSRDTPGWVASLSRCGEKSIFSDATRTACVPPASPGVPSCFAGKTYFQAGSASEGCPPLSSPLPSQETCFSSSLPRQCHQSLPTSASQGGDKPQRIWPSAFLSSKQNPHGAESRGVRTPEGPAEARLQVPHRTWGKLSALKSESGAGNPAPVEPRSWGGSLSLSLGKPAEVSKAPDNQKDRADSRIPPPRLPAGRPGGGRLWADLGKGSFLCSGASQEGTFKFQPSRDSGHPNAFEAEPPTSPEKSTYGVAQEVPLASRPRDLGCTYTSSLVPNAARGPSPRESLGTETQPAGVSSQSQTAHCCPSRNVARKSSQWLAASGGRIPQDDASERALGQTRSASGAGFASSPFQSFAERFPSQRRETLAKTTNVDAPPVPRARLRGCGLQVKPELRGVCTPRQVTQESRGHQAEDRGRGQRIERETIGSDLSNAENRGGGFCKTTRTPKLAGPAGVLLRRRQQADPAKRMKTESSRSPVASGTPRSAQGRSPQPSPDREDVQCVDSEEDSEVDGQNLGRNVAWIKALVFASLPLDDFHLGLTPFPSEAADLSCSFMYRDNISSILNRVAPAAYKVPQLIVSIKTSVARSRSAEATEEKVEEALLQVTDPTGEMPAAVHSRAVSLHGANFVSGAALLLRDVTVFLSNCRLPCLAIVHANILQIFPPEDWTASFQAAFSVERNKEALLTRVSDAGSKKFPRCVGPRKTAKKPN